MAADLNRDLANLNGAERHVLLSGSDRFSAANQSAPGELAEFKVKFTPGFQRAPWLITRVRELQIRGGPECGRQFTMHKVAVATEGFTFRLSSQRTCVVESFTGEWLAFAIEPATAFYDLDPKWRKPERPVTPP